MYKTTIHNYSNLSRDNNSSHFHHNVSPRNLYITKKNRYPWEWLLPLIEFPFRRQSTGCPKTYITYIQGVPKTWEFSDELDFDFVMN